MLDHKPHHKRLVRHTRLSPGRKKLEASGNYGGLKRKALGTAKPKPGSRRAIKAELDRVTSLLVRARDGRCVTCGTTVDLQCLHYFKRRFLATRWNLTNCNAQCARCNELHNRVPWPYRRYMVSLIGESGLDDLFELRNSVWRPSTEELKTLRLALQGQFNGLRRAA